MRTVVLFFSLFVVLTSQAQEIIRTIYNDISSKTEIPIDCINSVEQDSDGFVWVATWKGLFRFDGYKAVRFGQINPDFKGQKVTHLHYAKNGILWVSSYIDGVFAIDTKDYSVAHYHPEAEGKFKILDENIIHIYEHNNGEIWLGGEAAGISIIAGDSVRFITTENSTLLKGQVPEIFTSRDGKMWIGTGEGLQLYDRSANAFQRLFPDVLNQYIYDITEDKQGNIYVAHKTGLHKIIPSGNSFDIEEISKKLSSAILIEKEAANSTLLIGSLDGLYRYKTANGALNRIAFEPENSPINGHITDLFRTNDGTLFLATMRGLFNLYPQKKEFQPIRMPLNLSNDATVSAVSGHAGKIWFGTWGSGIFWVDEQQQVNKLEIETPDFDPFITSLLCDGKFVWFATKNVGGVFRFSVEDVVKSRLSKTKLKHFINYENNDELGEKFVLGIDKISENEIVFGTWEGELFYFDERTDKVVRYPNTTGAPFRGIPINCVVKDKNDQLWLATRGKGVFVLGRDSVFNYSTKNGLADDFVTHLYQSVNEKIWIATEKSLSVIDQEGKIQNYFQGFKRFDFQSISEDASGFLWLGTDKGLVRINSNLTPENYKFFNTKDGLINDLFSNRSVYKDEKGKIYFGGSNGLDAFFSHQFVFNYQVPKVRLTDFLLFHKRVQEGVDYSGNVLLKQGISRTNEIRLSHTQNTFEIEFSNLQYILPEKAIYKYKLEGADKEWIYAAQNDPRAYYTNLRWGDYTFLLTSCNNDGFWNDEPLKLRIAIRPPFWATYWAYAAYLSFVLFLIWFFAKRTVVKVKHLHAIELKELEYAKQKEVDEAKLRFFTNISHELRTPLTLIIGPLSRILQKQENDPHHDYHLLMFRNADRLLKLINRLMDFSKNEQAKLKLQVQKGDVVPHVNNIFLSFRLEATQKRIDYSFHAEENLPPIWFDLEFLESIVFNLLSNAFKFTPEEKAIRVELRKSQLKERPAIAISITDEGKGISKRNIERIFERFYSGDKIQSGTGIGLSFTKRLMDMHHGEITVNSIPEKGTAFTIYLSAEDIYTQAEKTNTTSDKETVVDWAKIETGTVQENSLALDQLKEDTDKDQLIALIVDDNADVRAFVKSILLDSFLILEADNGAKGLSVAQEIIPDIIISDVMMPKMTGYEFCEAVKKDSRTDHIPVILMTVLSSQEDRIKGLRYGADSYIPKPINPEHMLVRVQKLLEQQNRLKRKFTSGEIAIKPNPKAKETEKATVNTNPLIEKATNAILNKLDVPEYSVDDFAADLNLSRMQLYRKLKAITGLSANVFIRKVRLQKAAELLSTGEYNVKQVTYDVGFNDLKYFRKCFKEEFGKNPSDFLPDKDEGFA